MTDKKAINAVLKRSLGIGTGESLLIVADKTKEDISKQFLLHSRDVARKSEMIVIDPLKEHGQEPSQEVAKVMKEYDALILITEKSLTHTKARREANRKGVRIASMPGITEDMVSRCIDIDYHELKERTNTLCRLLSSGERINLLTEKGTDLSIDYTGRKIFPDDGDLKAKGSYGNLPAGEAAFSPKNANGIFIVDKSFPGLGKLSSPLHFHVKDGVVLAIKGKGSGNIKKRLDRIGPNAYVLAELGIGTNPRAIVTGNVLEDEKVLGTCHIALGNNESFGESNRVPVHLDGVIGTPTITVGKRIIIDKGNILF